jgi:mono/diheme cytochrome c family protein
MLRFAVAAVAAIAVLVPAYSAEHPGKAVYDQSCQNCHGKDGTGSNVADKFFQVQIPRLVSDRVQLHTNPELKEIILRGSGRMEPVKIGRPTLPHGDTKDLTEREVEDVIGYVRELGKAKKK